MVHKRARLGETVVKRGTISLNVRLQCFDVRSDKIVQSLPACPSGHIIAVGSKLVLSPRSVLNSRSEFMTRQREIRIETSHIQNLDGSNKCFFRTRLCFDKRTARVQYTYIYQNSIRYS